MNAILAVIREAAAQGSVHAQRDYAVTLFYLFSGLRRNELFSLRGKDVELPKAGLIVRYRRKGGLHQKREVSHPDVREALLAYLTDTHRLSALQTYAPLWTCHDRAREAGRGVDFARLRQQSQKVRGTSGHGARQYSPNAAHLRANYF